MPHTAGALIRQRPRVLGDGRNEALPSIAPPQHVSFHLLCADQPQHGGGTQCPALGRMLQGEPRQFLSFLGCNLAQSAVPRRLIPCGQGCTAIGEPCDDAGNRSAVTGRQGGIDRADSIPAGSALCRNQQRQFRIVQRPHRAAA
jgi:hypothetical protein